MNKCKYLVLAVVAAFLLLAAPPKAQAGVSINIGVAPVCPYGYYPTPPYLCAPYGYYGPEWFVNGIFIGAGPWYHGPAHFHGWVDQRYSRGRYRGPLPERGARPDRPVNKIEGFHKGGQINEQGKAYHGR